MAETKEQALEAALSELADLMDQIRAGDYAPDTFTTQPARAALALPAGAASPPGDARVCTDCGKPTERPAVWRCPCGGTHFDREGAKALDEAREAGRRAMLDDALAALAKWSDDARDDRSVDDVLRALAAAPPPPGTAPPAVCTGLAATWCPIHGDCKCASAENGERSLDDPSCPLHSATSDHAEHADDAFATPAAVPAKDTPRADPGPCPRCEEEKIGCRATRPHLDGCLRAAPQSTPGGAGTKGGE